jgi:hypothetical protein
MTASFRDHASGEDIFSCTIMVSPRLNRTGVGDNDPTIIEPDQVA